MTPECTATRRSNPSTPASWSWTSWSQTLSPSHSFFGQQSKLHTKQAASFTRYIFLTSSTRQAVLPSTNGRHPRCCSYHHSYRLTGKRCTLVGARQQYRVYSPSLGFSTYHRLQVICIISYWLCVEIRKAVLIAVVYLLRCSSRQMVWWLMGVSRKLAEELHKRWQTDKLHHRVWWGWGEDHWFNTAFLCTIPQESTMQSKG